MEHPPCLVVVASVLPRRWRRSLSRGDLEVAHNLIVLRGFVLARQYGIVRGKSRQASTLVAHDDGTLCVRGPQFGQGLVLDHLVLG